MEDVKEAQVVVVMVPFLAQSHLNQALELSCQISSFNIPVHYASSATHIHQAKVRFNSLNRLKHAKILFHELPTPHFHSPPPNPNENFPAHLQPSYDASILLREPMASLLREISAKARRVVVINDVMMAYVVQDVNTLPNVESYSFMPISAFTYFFGGMETGNPFQVEEVPEGLPSTEGTVTPEIANLVGLQVKFLGLASGTIMNSCRSIEGTYIDLYAKQQNAMNKQLWVFGPFNLWALNDDDRRNSSRQHKCLDWLDEQAPNSVLYVSFGTSSSFKDEQIKELATGLEQSQQKFIWVLREADRGDLLAGDVKRADVLPEGFEERVKGVGLVVRDWAPQVEILGHPSTGGFMSHCGWNSCLESITMGVPIAAWPMHSDQPRNAFLVTDVLKVGVVVNQWANRNKIVTAPTIATAVNRLMASVEGKEMKKRVMTLSDAAQQSVKEGGVSRKELDTFVAYITR